MGGLGLKGSLDEGGIAKRLWEKFKNERALALHSPYIVCLASGTLDPKSFLNCISQDSYFLQAFAHAYELAKEYADDDEDKDDIVKLRKRVLKRLKNQDTLIHEWGFEPPKETTCNNATSKYTEFLKETVLGKVGGEKFSVNIVTPFEKIKLAAYTLSVISPCMRLYSYICKEIRALLEPEESHIYKKWLHSLSSEKFEASASRIEDLLDKLSICLTGEELNVVERLYHRAMELELEFISTQSVVQQTIVPFSRFHNNDEEGNLVMCCDFDLTCTAIDSSALLTELAIVSTSNGYETDIRETWSSLISEYVEEYQQCIENMIPNDDGIDKFPFENGHNFEGLYKTLEQISNFEKKANSRVVHSDVLKGLKLEDIRRAGDHLGFQDGCKKFFQDVLESKNCTTDVHVLSYCWCGDLIKSAFSGILNEINIHSNDLDYQESISTGNIITRMESPMDKLKAFDEIKNHSKNKGKPLTVYIGGSIGDLLCLLEADIGIVIGSSTSLIRIANHFGVSFVPLFSGLISKQRELSETGKLGRNCISSVLYTVSNWDEIYAFILG